MKRFYLALCVVGFLVPYGQFIPWVVEHGINLPLLVRDLFANRISSFFGLDVLVSAAVLCIFIVVEGTRLGMRRLWLPIVATCAAGVSLGCPCFFIFAKPTWIVRPTNKHAPQTRDQYPAAIPSLRDSLAPT